MVASRYLRFSMRRHAELRQDKLERLLLYAGEPEGVLDWRQQAFELLSPGSIPPPIGPAAAFGRIATSVNPNTICVASPVDYIAELSNVRMAAEGVLRLNPREASALTEDFNRVWADADLELKSADDLLLLCFNSALQVATVDPQTVAGRHLEPFLPAGQDGARLRRLMSEIEMWLYEHPVNRDRAQRGEPTIKGLWLWGAGAPLVAPAHSSIAALGDDVLFRIYNVQDAARANLMVTQAVPGTPEWQKVQLWLDLALMQWRRGECRQLTLSAGERCVQLQRGWRMRFWRRPQPWWTYFE